MAKRKISESIDNEEITIINGGVPNSRAIIILSKINRPHETDRKIENTISIKLL